LCNPRDRSISSFLCQRRPLQCGDVHRDNIKTPRPNILTENTVRERVQCAALSDLHIVSPARPLFTRRLLPEFLFVHEKTGVTDKPLQLAHDVHGRWSRRLYYAEEAR